MGPKDGLTCLLHCTQLWSSISILCLNGSKWFYWIGCLCAAHRSLNVCVNFSFFVVFVRKLLVGFLLLFFLQKSLASIGWLILSFLFIFFDQVGGWSSCSFSKALVWWGWIVCNRYTLRCMDYHLKMLLLFSLIRLVGGLVAAGYSGHVSWRWWRWGHRVTHHPHASH